MRVIAADGSSFFGHTVWQLNTVWQRKAPYSLATIASRSGVALVHPPGAEDRPRQLAQMFGLELQRLAFEYFFSCSWYSSSPMRR